MNAILDSLWLGAISAFAAVAAITPLARRLWVNLGNPDRERSLRKVHKGEVPRVGGAVLLVVVSAIILWGFAGKTELSRVHRVLSASPLTGVLAGSAVAGLAGLYDDLYGLRPRYKILAQIAGAMVALGLGLRWGAMEALFDPNWASASLTVAFLVVAINALNLIDGLDGLAGGIVVAGLVTIIAATVAGGADASVGWVAAVALGGVVGFLVHNRHPARVFLGDSGAFFLGFLLAGLLLFLDPVRPRKVLVNLSIPLLVLALPLLDTGLAIFRRLARGQPIASGDADHVHHRLLRRGFTQWQAVGTLWGVSALFGGLAYLTVVGVGGSLTLAGALLVSMVVPAMLGYHRILHVVSGPDGRSKPWMDRRRTTMDLVRGLQQLGTGPNDRGPERWQRLMPLLAPTFSQMGIGAYELRSQGKILATQGETDGVQAWLGFPLAPGSELRLAVSGSLTGVLPPDQQHLLERILELLSGVTTGTRDATGRHSMLTSSS